MDEQALKELPVRVNTRPLEFVRRIDLDPNRVDPSKIWVICKDYPRDAKTALVYRVPASVLHERENAIEPKFVSWAPGRRGFCRVTTTSRPASVQKPVFA